LDFLEKEFKKFLGRHVRASPSAHPLAFVARRNQNILQAAIAAMRRMAALQRHALVVALLLGLSCLATQTGAIRVHHDSIDSNVLAAEQEDAPVSNNAALRVKDMKSLTVCRGTDSSCLCLCLYCF
jgi:hypothetical protein